MIEIKTFFLALLSINMFALLMTSFTYMHSRQTQNVFKTALRAQVPSPVKDIAIDKTFAFEDSFVAFHLLQQLDVFESMGPHDYSVGHSSGGLLWGLTIDNNYCDKHRYHFASNPEFIFKEMNFLADEHKSHLLRDRVIPSVGQEVHPEVGYDMDRKIRDTFTIDQKPNINIFYTNVPMHERRAAGVQYSCLTQISNHIPGNEKMSKKDHVGDALFKYTKKYASQPSCFNNKKFFPRTWVLSEADQCREFFAEFNSPQYFTQKKQRNVVYFRKLGSEIHRGEGVFPVDNIEENYIRHLYKNGTLCGKVEDNNIMQWSIHNPLLVEGRKFDMRVHMFIASTNPLIAYYHDGFLGLSLHQYNANSQEKGAYLTNIALNGPIFDIAEKNGTYQGLALDELKEKTYWPYARLHKYLMDQGKVTDPDWLDNFLRPEMKKIMIHLIRMGQDTLVKKSSLHEIYGVDIMMDENMDLWFIEANARPAIQGWTPETDEVFNKMLIDSFEIVFGLLRSRTKRIINYINYLTSLNDAWEYENGALNVTNLQQRREEFRELSKNRFEPEYEPRPTNGFQKIIDENEVEFERYMGLIDRKCL